MTIFVKYLLLFSIIASCITTLSAQKIKVFKVTDFKEIEELKGIKLNLSNPLKNPHEILLIDSLLLIKNINASPAVDVINLKTEKIISQFCKRGRGPGELIAPFSIQYIRNDREVMVQDIQGKKLVFFDLDLIIKNSPKKYVRIVKTDTVLVRKVQQVKTGKFFCDLIGHANGYMNCLLNKDGELIRFLQKYPQIDVHYNPTIASNIFATNIGASPNQEKIIVPYIYSDKIEIFNYSGDVEVQLIGPNFKKLDVINTSNRATLTTKNNRAYVIPCANDNYFMIPYSGKQRNHSIPPANNIFTFDFKGNLLKRYIVSPSVNGIAVDWDRKIIYGVNKDMEPTIYKYHF